MSVHDQWHPVPVSIMLAVTVATLGWLLAGCSGHTPHQSASTTLAQLSADVAYRTPQDIVSAMQQSGVACADAKTYSPPGTGANGQISCQTQYGLIEVYTFDSPAMQAQWSSALSPLCGAAALSGTLSAQYIKGKNWTILADASQGTSSPNSAPQSLSAAIHIATRSFCDDIPTPVATSTNETVEAAPTPTPSMSCSDLAGLSVSYTIASKDESGVGTDYWPRVTVRNGSKLPVTVTFDGEGVSSPDPQFPDLPPLSMKWGVDDSPVSVNPGGEESVDLGYQFGEVLYIVPNAKIAKFTVTATAGTTDGALSGCAIAVNRSR